MNRVLQPYISSPKPWLLATLLLWSAGAWSRDFSIDWYSIDGGGVIESQSPDQQWQLSGTLGQWDGSQARALSGNGWTLTGGFWSAALPEKSDVLFRDRFQVLAGSRQRLWIDHSIHSDPETQPVIPSGSE